MGKRFVDEIEGEVRKPKEKSQTQRAQEIAAVRLSMSGPPLLKGRTKIVKEVDGETVISYKYEHHTLLEYIKARTNLDLTEKELKALQDEYRDEVNFGQRPRAAV